ncbi:MAG: hypothetical protein V1750_04205, partial [Acidobacteriota bacterium]
MKRLSLMCAVAAAGCSMGDSSLPVSQPDTPVYGRVAAVRELAGEPGIWELEAKAGLPESLQAVMRRERKLIPFLEKDLAVKIRVTPDSLCIANLRATDVDSLRAGQEFAAIPRPGSCAMVGTKLLLAEAAEVYLFSAYQVRFLPRSLELLPKEVTAAGDEARINSPGYEGTPLPIRGGQTVYFAAGLLPSWRDGGSPRGAVRDGMRLADGTLAPWAVGGTRPYRVEWQGSSWGKPERVVLAGVPEAASARLTW